MHISNSILFILFQGFIVFAGYAIYLYIAKTRLTKANSYLKARFKESIIAQKKMMAEIYNSKKASTCPIESYKQQIDLSLKETEKRQREIEMGKNYHQNTYNEELKAVQLRHNFLSTEKSALDANTHQDDFWKLMEQSYMEIINKLLLDEDSSDISNSIEDAQETIAAVKDLDIKKLLDDEDYQNNIILMSAITIYKLRFYQEDQTNFINSLKEQLSKLNEMNLSGNVITHQKEKIEMLEKELTQSQTSINNLKQQQEDLTINNDKLQLLLTSRKERETDLNDIIKKFIVDSRDMVLCIEKLEKERDQLNKQLSNLKQKDTATLSSHPETALPYPLQRKSIIK